MSSYDFKHWGGRDRISNIEQDVDALKKGGGSSSSSSLAWFNVADYGAVGDGATDDSSAIQSAINDAVAANAGTVFFPDSTGYYCATGLTCTSGGIALISEGRSGQSTALGKAGCRIIVGSGQVGFTYAPATLQYKAPYLRGLHFVDKTPGSALGGILIQKAVGAKITDCYASDFTAGYGMSLSASGAGPQYSTLINPIISKCQTGIIVTNTNGVEIFGGLIDQDNSGSAVSGSTGLQLVSGDTFRAFGLRIQFQALGIDQQSGSLGAEFYGLRLEGCTTMVQIAGNNCAVYGGAFSNSILGSTGTAFKVLSGATNNILMPTHCASDQVAAPLTDSGTGTVSGGALVSSQQGGAYSVSNATPSRTIDASSASSVANGLAQLIVDLRRSGVIV